MRILNGYALMEMPEKDSIWFMLNHMLVSFKVQNLYIKLAQQAASTMIR
jgi:hypothetical protein